VHSRLASTAAIAVGLAVTVAGPGIASASPLAAPRPTSTAASPGTPDPHPPLGGKAPNGTVPGGDRLAERGVILPQFAPKLPPHLTAASWVLADLGSGQILAARDPHGRYQPASILKILTAITVLPNLPPKQIVTVSKAAAAAEGSAVGLLAGAKYTVDQLFDALLLVSGNDAAAALAEANGGVAKTVADMNAKAESLGAYDTVVQTPSGLDGWQQLTSAYDMALVLRAAVDQPRLLAYDRLRSASYPAKTSKYGHVGAYEFDNQTGNYLNSVRGALLAKTGFTDAAQHTFLCAAERNGRRLGIVMLRNQRTPIDQDQQAAELLNWGFALTPDIAPVGSLAGVIGSENPNDATAARGSADGAAGSGTALSSRTLMAAQGPIRLSSSSSARDDSVPATVAIAAALLLVCVAAALLMRRRAQRLH
jgi:D-alanyl-D-alanine carboxypeptidase (penicillin-binding protein 5/6)